MVNGVKTSLSLSNEEVIKEMQEMNLVCSIKVRYYFNCLAGSMIDLLGRLLKCLNILIISIEKEDIPCPMPGNPILHPKVRRITKEPNVAI